MLPNRDTDDRRVKIKAIGFELEGKFNQVSNEEITDFIYDVKEDGRHWISEYWHGDSVCSKEFKTSPILIENDPFAKLKEFHALCKDRWDTYDLKSVHCNISFEDPMTDTFVSRMIDGLMPIAVIFRSVKQNSLLDAWSQWFNCFQHKSRGMIRKRHFWKEYADCEYPYYNGMEIRFAGKHYWIYEKIVEAMQKIPDNVSDWHLTRYQNNRFLNYPDNAKTLFECNKDKSYSVSIALIDDIDAPKDIKKLFLKESRQRRGSNIILSYLFPWLVQCWAEYLPETTRYIDDELLPNLSDKMKHHIRSLRRNKYRFPFIRAWKNMLKSVGRIGYSNDLANALEKFSVLSPVSDIPIKRVEGKSMKLARCYIPDFKSSLPSIANSGLRDINFRFNCPSLIIEGAEEDTHIDRLTFSCDARIPGCANRCCLYCGGDSVRPDQRCKQLCTEDKPRCDMILPRNPYLQNHHVFPQEVAFEVCHECTNNCDKCKCLICEHMAQNRCRVCSNVKSGEIHPNVNFSKYELGGYYTFTAEDTYLAFSMIMKKCENFLFHNLLYIKCLKERCGLQGCCYLCRHYNTCDDTGKCKDLGDKQSVFETRAVRPNIINPNMPPGTRYAKIMKYRSLPIEVYTPNIINILRVFKDEIRGLTPLYHSCVECDEWNSINGSMDCYGCEKLNPYRCRDCLRSIGKQNGTKFCSKCTRQVGHWYRYHQKYNILIPHSTDEYICEGNDDDVEWKEPPEVVPMARAIRDDDLPSPSSTFSAIYSSTYDGTGSYTWR